MDSFFDRALLAARRLGASDVHFKPGLSPILRIAGELRTLSDVPPLSREFLHSLGLSLLNDRRRETLERTGDVIVALATSNGGRQRAHLFHHRGGLSLALRLIPPEVPALDTLGLPAEVRELTEPGAGLVHRGRRPRAGEDHHAGGAGRGSHRAAPLPRRDDRGPGRVSAQGSTRRGRPARGRDRRPLGGGGAAFGEPAGRRRPGRRRSGGPGGRAAGRRGGRDGPAGARRPPGRRRPAGRRTADRDRRRTTHL